MERVRFYLTPQDSTGNAYAFDYPLYVVLPSGDTLSRTWPGQPDSALIELPCRSHPVTYAASCVAIDTAGNASGPSNVVTFTR